MLSARCRAKVVPFKKKGEGSEGGEGVPLWACEQQARVRRRSGTTRSRDLRALRHPTRGQRPRGTSRELTVAVARPPSPRWRECPRFSVEPLPNDRLVLRAPLEVNVSVRPATLQLEQGNQRTSGSVVAPSSVGLTYSFSSKATRRCCLRRVCVFSGTRMNEFRCHYRFGDC
jgi:hypothetical protein